MIINIEDIENSKDGVIFVDYEEENKELEAPNNLRAVFSIKKYSSSINITGKITGWVEKTCDRCLKNFNYEIDLDVNETISLKPIFDYSSNDIRIRDGQFEDELLNSNILDLNNFIYQSVTLSFPNKIVCDINCNGSIELQILKKDFIQDPRLEIFNKLKKDN